MIFWKSTSEFLVPPLQQIFWVMLILYTSSHVKNIWDKALLLKKCFDMLKKGLDKGLVL